MALVDKEALYSAVYQVVLQIPKGKVATYGQIAHLLGLPRYARHVGHALSNLPDDSDLPWHRVVNSQGKMHSRHSGKPSFQQELLAQEGIIFNKSGIISLKIYQWTVH